MTFECINDNQTGNYKIIDHERSIIIEQTFGDSSGYQYTMDINGVIVKSFLKQNISNGIVDWSVTNISYPTQFCGDKNLTKEVLREGLTVLMECRFRKFIEREELKVHLNIDVE